jgi:hypothetical protein
MPRGCRNTAILPGDVIAACKRLPLRSTTPRRYRHHQKRSMTREHAMIRYWRRFIPLGILLAPVSLSGCTSDPSAPVNQAFPIRQMDQFFGSLPAPPAPPLDYTRQPGYAPAYPPYPPQMTAGRPADNGAVE